MILFTGPSIVRILPNISSEKTAINQANSTIKRREFYRMNLIMFYTFSEANQMSLVFEELSKLSLCKCFVLCLSI